MTQIHKSKEEKLNWFKEVLERDYIDSHDNPMLYISEDDVRWLMNEVSKAKSLEVMKQELIELAQAYRAGHVGGMTDSFLVDEVLAVLMRNRAD